MCRAYNLYLWGAANDINSTTLKCHQSHLSARFFMSCIFSPPLRTDNMWGHKFEMFTIRVRYECTTRIVSLVRARTCGVYCVGSVDTTGVYVVYMATVYSSVYVYLHSHHNEQLRTKSDTCHIDCRGVRLTLGRQSTMFDSMAFINQNR